MSKKVFLDSDIFFDCIENSDKKTPINHAINRGFQFFTSLSVIGEVILIIKRDEQSRFVDSLLGFFSMLTDWNVTILVPNAEVAVICYEFSLDLTDGRIISQSTDRTHLAYAIAYDCDYLITSDDALIRYRIPGNLIEAEYVKPETLPLDEFRDVVTGN
jgi:predicted nucleic acid-binding protein